MYGARMARFDLLRPVQGLARMITKWGVAQDDDLHRLMCYIQTTKHWRTVGWMGDAIDLISPVVFTDSDCGGNGPLTQQCTSGVFCGLRGPNSSFPILQLV